MKPEDIVAIPGSINKGLSAAKNSTMIQLLGTARDTFDGECRGATNDPVKSLLVTESVGPFRVTGLGVAVASLRDVLVRIKAAHPDVHGVLGTAGMFCARLIANSTKISNHSWGTAIDIKIGSVLDGIQSKTAKADGKTLHGLAVMAPFFNEAGWYWGAGFSTFEDGMHFEVADETIRAWHATGKLGAKAAKRTAGDPTLSMGDRGVEVRRLQEALQAKGVDILPDGVFGPVTQAAVINFQAANGLVADGIVGAKTKKKLGLK